MTLFENLLMLKEFAYNRKKCLDKLDDMNPIRYEHLIKLFFFRNKKDEFNHWCKEVANYSILYSSKVKIKEKDILNVIWTKPKDNYTHNRIQVMLDNFTYDGYFLNDEYHIFNYTNLYHYLEDFHIWLSKILYACEVVSISQIINKISQLLNKYAIR